MYCERQKLGTWATGCAVLAICLGSAIPAFAQKFANRSRPPASSTVVSATEDEASSIAVETRPVRTRANRVPDWQQTPGRVYRSSGRAAGHDRMAMQEMALQEVVFTDGEPTLADSELIAPGMMEGEVVQGGAVQHGMAPGGPAPDGYFEEPGDMTSGCATCGDPMFDDHVCGPGCNDGNCPRYRPCDGICIPRHRVEEHSLFIGPQAFKGPLDLGRNGNFGFHEGVNFAGQFGRKLGLGPLGIGYQAGAMFAQSNFYGNQVNGLETKGRDQQFVTAGLFRRARCYGIQGGAVFDYLHDNYYVKYNVGQVRAELSYLNPYGHEIGFLGGFHVRPGRGQVENTSNQTFFTQNYSTIDYYNLFYRCNLPNGSWGRIWGGANGNKGGMVGADFRMPLTNQWDLNGMFNFLVPGPGAGIGGQTHEGWGLIMNLAWFPGRPQSGVHNGYYRSLFSVANNGWMFVKQR